MSLFPAGTSMVFLNMLPAETFGMVWGDGVWDRVRDMSGSVVTVLL